MILIIKDLCDVIPGKISLSCKRVPVLPPCNIVSNTDYEKQLCGHIAQAYSTVGAIWNLALQLLEQVQEVEEVEEGAVKRLHEI